MKLVQDQLTVQNFINGDFEQHQEASIDVISPLDGGSISRVPISTKKQLDKAVKSASTAFVKWSQLTLKERVQVFFRYRNLLEENIEELSNLIRLENGKTFGEAKAEVEKGIELCEFAVSLHKLYVMKYKK